MLAEIGGAMGLILGLNILDLILLAFKSIGILKKAIKDQIKNMLRRSNHPQTLNESSETEFATEFDCYHARCQGKGICDLPSYNQTQPILTVEKCKKQDNRKLTLSRRKSTDKIFAVKKKNTTVTLFKS